ncbi:Poll [Symbiodinium natans]|uniref:Poll protein n=1 Tax=Symbiodinium natans TaxID=878477 RepID=A0A812FVS4_9DINO|nr:Poll [Symbiodinium natans]
MPKLAVLNEAEEEVPEGANAAEVVVGIADMIGIDIVNEPQFLWIAEEASRAHIPPDWKELTNEDGEVLYYHTQERKLQKVHPLILRYQEVYFKARSYTKQLESGQIGNLLEQTDAKMAAITASVMGRASKGLPPATPEVVESLARVLGVESTKEFFLFRVVKQTIEAYVEKKLDLSSIVQDLKDPIEFLRQIRKKQNQVDVIRKPTTVVMCQECENRAAVLKCEQCKDFFCQDCFNSTHATGKRRAHITSDVEQLVCAAFEDRVATCQCVQCGLFYSDEGFMHVHAWDAARPDLRNHLKRVINGLVCLECEHYNASVLCEVSFGIRNLLLSLIGFMPKYAQPGGSAEPPAITREEGVPGILCERVPLQDCVDLFCTECFIRPSSLLASLLEHILEKPNEWRHCLRAWYALRTTLDRSFAEDFLCLRKKRRLLNHLLPSTASIEFRACLANAQGHGSREREQRQNAMNLGILPSPTDRTLAQKFLSAFFCRQIAEEAPVELDPDVSNAAIARQLKELAEAYSARGDRWRSWQLAKAERLVRTWPEPLRQPEDFDRIAGLGPKTREKCREILATGGLNRLDAVRGDEATKILQDFTCIHGAGESVARRVTGENEHEQSEYEQKENEYE